MRGVIFNYLNGMLERLGRHVTRRKEGDGGGGRQREKGRINEKMGLQIPTLFLSSREINWSSATQN